MTRPLATLVPAAFAALSLCACVDDDDPTLGSADQAINAGVPDVDTFDNNTTVFVATASGGACSGTVIGSRQVLTAAHCLTRPVAPWEPPNILASTFDGAEVWAASDEPDPTAGDPARRAFRIYRYPVGRELDRPWAFGGALPPSRIKSATTTGAAVWAVTDGSGLFRDAGDGLGFVFVGTSGGVVAMTATASFLVGVTASNQLVVRSLELRDEVWTPIGAGPGGVITGLGVDPNGRIYAAAPGATLKYRDPATGLWPSIGALPGEPEAMTAGGNYLFARVGTTIYWRPAAPWASSWSALAATDAGAVLAGGDNVLHSFTATTRRRREVQRRWIRTGETVDCRPTALAVTATRVFAACAATAPAAAVLRARPRSGGGWTSVSTVGDTGPGPITGMTDDGAGGLIASSASGVFTLNPSATRWTGPVEVPTAPLVRMDVAAGLLYAADSAGSLRVRPLGSTTWRVDSPGPGPGPQALAVRSDTSEAWTLWSATWPMMRWDVSPLTNVAAFSATPARHWTSPLHAYPIGPVTISVGNDLAARRPCSATAAHCVATSARFPGDLDMAVLELPGPITRAAISPVLLDGAPASSAWRDQDLAAAGYGLSEEGALASHAMQWQPATRTWSDLGLAAVTRPDGAVATATDVTTDRVTTATTVSYLLDQSSAVWKRDAGGVYSIRVPLSFIPNEVVSIAAMGATRLFAALPSAVLEFDAAGNYVADHTPALAVGERITALAQGNGWLWTATSAGRLHRKGLLGGASVETLPGPTLSLAADGNDLWVLTVDRQLYRRTAASAFAHQGEAPGVQALAADRGVVTGFRGGAQRFRQRGDVFGLTWPSGSWAHAEGRGGHGWLPGDSGGSLFWFDGSGRRWLAGVLVARAQAATVTWNTGGSSGGLWLPNTREWLRSSIRP